MSGKSLENQVVLVTGSSSGIGAGIAVGMGKAGAKVVVNYRSSAEGAEKVVNEIKSQGGEAIAIQGDISKEEDVQKMFSQLCEQWGTIDILINNAGLQQDANLVDMTLGQWQTVMDVNLTGQFLCTREAVKEFMRRGIVEERSRAAGKIILISSVHEIIPWAGHSNYAASKGGIKLFMQSIAQEVAHHKIRVNGIAPGAIKTPINEDAWDTPEDEAKLLKLIPYKRIGIPEDIAKVAVWLASDDSDYVHGETIFVDGGMTLYPAFAEGQG